jgi:putative transposase
MNSAADPLKERRSAARYATERGLSQRRSCRLVALNRSTARYISQGSQVANDADLAQKIQAVQAALPRYGVRRVSVRLRKSGQSVNHKRVQRVMNIYKLQVVRTRRRKTIRTGAHVPGKAEYPNHVWTIDFQEDALINGRKVRLLNILDKFTREWLAVVVGTTGSAKTVMAALTRLFHERNAPAFLRSDNGGEFVAGNLAVLLTAANVAAKFIDPASPWQNGFIESFHGKLRDELLNREAFLSIREAQVRLEDHRNWYNQYREHSALTYLSPTEFRQKWQRQYDQAQETNQKKTLSD